MKRITLLLLLLLGTILFAVAHTRRQPKPVSLKEYSAGRLQIHYVPSDHLSENLKEFANRIESNLQDAEKFTGRKLDKPLQVYLFANWEEKGNYIEDVRIAHADSGAMSIYCIVNSEWDGIAERPEFQIALKHAFGPPAIPQMEEYVASALAGVYFGKKLDDWEAFLKTRKLIPDFPALLQDQQSSRFVRHAWSASLARWLLKDYGSQAFIELYQKGILPSDYADRWQSQIAKVPTSDQKRTPFTPEFQKGVSYAYSNSYDAGYATNKSGRSLNKLRSLGVNWVASIPYGFMRSNQAIEIRYPRYHIAGENDESLWALSAHARELGMKVMLKPQIWISHKSWPGNIKFNSPEQWNQWFDAYEKWILHYAIIAELTGAELFCIGTELVQATLNHPDRWRDLISKIRTVYHGPITYAANWGREFEQIQFWESMDYIGLDNYYAVRSSENQDSEQMKLGFAKQKDMIRRISFRFCRPVLFTEIGYMANRKAGMGMKEFEAIDSEYDEKAQEICYRLAMETYWNEPWFYGMYWWKWFSDPGDKGRYADSHSPHDREAEEALSEWYNKNRS